MSEQIEIIIVRCLIKSATASDLDKLSEWIKNPKNKGIFKKYIWTHYIIHHSMSNPDTKKVLKELLTIIKKEKTLIHKLKNLPIYKYATAAIFIGIMFFIYLSKNSNISERVLENNTSIFTKTNIKSDKYNTTLTLENGTQIILKKGENLKLQNAKSDGEQIIYKDKKNKLSQVEYNLLTVPRSCKFHVNLSDGTKVWLNSESQLKYPVSFIEGNTRFVELSYGEAYFNVSPSTNHSGSKFIVYNQSQEIEVLGTEFNIKAYRDETNIVTTLVEGEIRVSTPISNEILKPNQQSEFNIENNFMSIADINIEHEVSWVKGYYSFRGKPLEDIMKTLSRWYDVDIRFENRELKKIGFNGVIRRNQSIENILEIIKNYNFIKDYYITSDDIITLK